MRQAEVIEEGEYYHVYNRGNRKQQMFHDQRDYARFVFLILHSHGTFVPSNTHRHISYFLKDATFKVQPEDIRLIEQSRKAELVVFALMPNHFHLILREKLSGGISSVMQRVLTGYTKYYNEKYKQSGHLLQGKFGRIHIADNRQLLHTSAYIHRNPRELKGWENKEHKYPWSTLQDYVIENRWGNLLEQNSLLEQFSRPDEYHHFVKTSPSKDPLFEIEL